MVLLLLPYIKDLLPEEGYPKGVSGTREGEEKVLNLVKSLLCPSCPPPTVPCKLLSGDSLSDSSDARVGDSSSHEFTSLGIHEEVDILFIPFKDTARKSCHEGPVEGVRFSGTPPSQPPHKVPNVKANLESPPLGKEGL